ncbi:hypothetical protein BGW36DRAFT_363050 [Talaromyces proteolyticus]|uniref:Uncharacterized protein n=1 Tax=Talaromyces proteolyticus TaxID=1131652 RepID=A0AAD4PSU1_9EURO|nr:uncharacterized protein BGW36DRAFT_363050 [Talaromyces proteolyticus]KAH8692036.1 hypothetical protein BGW36DRAFT_363050 [Talaromyces proteolyticus]
MVSTAYNAINTRKLRYTGDAMAAFKANKLDDIRHKCKNCNIDNDDGDERATNSKSSNDAHGDRIWFVKEHKQRPPLKVDDEAISRHTGGHYPLTSDLSSWVLETMHGYQPDNQVMTFIEPFSAKFHVMVDKERICSSGLHDLDLVEFTYQVALEVGSEILLAADATEDPVELQQEFHSSRAGADDHFSSWGRLLTGLECDPPIIAMFPVYLMMCQAFTFERDPAQADYVYSALTGIDWAKGKNIYSDRIAAFEKLARSSVSNLDDIESGQDRSFWRIAHAYLAAMNGCENLRPLKTPRNAAINHQVNHELVLAMRALDTIGSAYMCSDGAAWLDDAGMDSLIGSAIPNDVMDLHTDIRTGETRNTIRLLYPEGLSISQAMKAMSTVLSGQLCEIFRGHQRARFYNREDGRIAATSPPYSFCRARHRRIFEIMEMYINKYADDFWDWTWEIFRMAKEQVTEAGLKEPLICALLRSVKQEDLPTSPTTKFYDIYYDMIEDGSEQLNKKQPLGVSDDLVQVTRDIYSLWHTKLLADNKDPGWGHRFDVESDRLFGEAGSILAQKRNADNMYKFAIAYGRLSMALPYIAYHTIDAIIMAFGIL